MSLTGERSFKLQETPVTTDGFMYFYLEEKSLFVLR